MDWRGSASSGSPLTDLFRGWNSYVAVGQMGGHGNFSDARIGPTITQTPDLVTSQLPALLDYQLSLQTPAPPPGSFDPQAAKRGSQVFRTQGRCATLPSIAKIYGRPQRTQSSGAAPSRSIVCRHGSRIRRADGDRKLQNHAIARALAACAIFHDGSAPDLLAVVNHYDRLFALGLSPRKPIWLI